MKRSSSFSQRMLKILWGRSGNSCAFPGCSQILVSQLKSEDYSVIGDMAHIIAVSKDGPRGKRHELSLAEISNIILLCPTHHRLIDQDPVNYPPEKLQRWKKDHENAVIDTVLSRSRPVISYALQEILKPDLPEESSSSKHYVMVKFKSVKLQYEWDYQVDADTTCEKLANTLAEQHFSPFQKSFKWHLSSESGRIYRPKKKIGKVLPKKGGTVLLRMTYMARPLDPAYGLPRESDYWSHELACSGDFLRYIKKWEKLVLELPNDTQHMNMLAWLYGEANTRINHAKELLQRCFDLDKDAENNPAILDTSGWLDYRMQRYEIAELKLFNSLEQKTDFDENYYVVLYHLYFTWRAIGKDAFVNEARKRINGWLSGYGQDMLIRMRVAQNNDSLLIPPCRYLEPRWLSFFGISRISRWWWDLRGTP